MTDTSVQNAAEAMAQDPGTGFQRVESRLPKASDPHERLAQVCHDLQVHQTELEQQNQELRQLQAVLEASRERYADLYDFAPVGYLVLDRASRIQTINLTGASLLERPRERLVGRSLSDLLPSEDRYRLQAHLLATLGTRGRRTDEVRLRGHILMLESVPEGDERGELVRTILTDITAHRAAEQERQRLSTLATQERTRRRLIGGLERISTPAATGAAPETPLERTLDEIRALFGIDGAWLLRPCDPAATTLEIRAETGNPAAPGRVATAGPSIASAPALAALMERTLRDGPVVTHPDDRVGWPAGQPLAAFPLIAVAVRPATGPPWLLGLHGCDTARIWDDEEQALLAAIADRLGQILDGLTTRQALAESEERYRSTFEQAAVGIAHMDPSGRFLLANQRLCAILDYPEAELLQLTCHGLIHAPDAEVLARHLRQARDRPVGASDRAIEVRFLTGGGKTRWCRLTTSALLRPASRLPYLMSIVEDIQANKDLEQQLAEHRNTLARLGRINCVSALAAGIAHELNQPLMAIGAFAGGACERMDRSPGDQAIPRAALLEIIGLANRASRILKHLRGLATQQPQELSALDLNQVLTSAIAMIRGEAQEQGVSLIRLGDPDAPSVLGDPIQLEQVLINLLLNGIEAMVETPTRLRRLQVRVSVTAARHVQVEVADRGGGLPTEGIDRLFDPFYTTKDGGTGLGLFIGQDIVAAHGGRMWARPRRRGGAVIGFSLPEHRITRAEVDGHE
ncbi:PAS domain S-box [Thioflavicoccus mobilis 8321]|uniref:histidine kinase n=1 Tax=Thioflavicoccus mobilis 8321 TaxID=765912 RepID=L0GZD5_9GAMM|nr:PAS domain S-box protein [Thioflavicoccus mobilis]AGA91197.1 PAS domain S-box [Thioflavicoccus mobilis 8321]